MRDAERENLLLEWDLGIPTTTTVASEAAAPVRPATAAVRRQVGVTVVHPGERSRRMRDGRGALEQRRRRPGAPEAATATASCRGSTSTPGAGAGRGRAGAAARAGQVPGHLRPEPRRVLPGPGGRPEGPGGRRPGHASPDGRTPPSSCSRSASGSTSPAAPQERIFLDEVAPALAGAGIVLSSWSELDDDDEKYLGRDVRGAHLPGAHPAGRRPGHPFPYISNLSLNLAVVVRDPTAASSASPG